VQIVEAEKRSV